MWREAGTWVRDLALSVLIALVVILFLYQPVKVEGTSMMPALEDQERVFINKFLYRLHWGRWSAGTRWCSGFRAIRRSRTSSGWWAARGHGGGERGEGGGERAGVGGTVRSVGVPGPDERAGSDGAGGILLRAGGSPELFERQPELGAGAAGGDIWQGGIFVLALGQGGVGALRGVGGSALSEEPRDKRENQAEDQAGGEGEIEGPVLAAQNEVAWQAADAEWEARAEPEEEAGSERGERPIASADLPMVRCTRRPLRMEGASPLSDYSGEGLVVGTEKHIHVLCTVNSQMMLCKDIENKAK